MLNLTNKTNANRVAWLMDNMQPTNNNSSGNPKSHGLTKEMIVTIGIETSIEYNNHFIRVGFKSLKSGNKKESVAFFRVTIARPEVNGWNKSILGMSETIEESDDSFFENYIESNEVIEPVKQETANYNQMFEDDSIDRESLTNERN